VNQSDSVHVLPRRRAEEEDAEKKEKDIKAIAIDKLPGAWHHVSLQA
jgi:hypothetical protein